MAEHEVDPQQQIAAHCWLDWDAVSCVPKLKSKYFTFHIGKKAWKMLRFSGVYHQYLLTRTAFHNIGIIDTFLG